MVKEKSIHATHRSSLTLVPHDSLHARVGLGAHTAALRPPLLGSEERRRQNAHRPSDAPHTDRCAEALHGEDALRRLEARHGSCCRTVLRVLAHPNFEDPKRVAAGRDDVAVSSMLAGKTLHHGESVARELVDLPAGRDVPPAHRMVVVAGADDLCAVVAKRYLGHKVFVPRQRVHLQNISDSESVPRLTPQVSLPSKPNPTSRFT